MRHNIKVGMVKIDIELDGTNHTLELNSESIDQASLESNPAVEISRIAVLLVEFLLIEAGELPLANDSLWGNSSKTTYNPAMIKKYGQKATEECARELMEEKRHAS